MEKRVAVFALSEPNAIQAIMKLKQNNDITLCAWLGVDKGQGVINYDYKQLFDVDVQQSVALPIPDDIYDKVYSHLWKFLNMVYRNGDLPIYKYVNMFNLLLTFYYGLFVKEKINLLIFGDIPHFGVDSIAKDLADAMGIKTVMFMQALESNRFFAFTDVNDIGEFKTLANVGAFVAQVEKKFEKDLYYMKNMTICCPADNAGSTERVFLRKIYHTIKKHPEQVWEKGKRFVLRKVKEKTLREIAESEYKSNSHINVAKKTVDLKCEFVYFPLHMQPEMTTSVLGGKFCDQILAIERLREILPADWKIYVKENPKQSYYMRDDLFFRRLQLVPNTFLIGKEVNTYDLIRNAQFVATITGTAGWEAISGGKCVLVFGLAWYRKLPGVFEYKNGVSVEEILNFHIEHDLLVRKYQELMSRAYVGVLECGAEEDVEDYSEGKNNEYLYDAFRKIVCGMSVKSN